MNYRILVADELSQEGLAILARAGEVVLKKGMDETTLRASLPGFHALVVRSATLVTARSLELADKLAVIGRAGIGVDNIDVEAATERGIVVMNTPEAGAVTTGELAFALLISMARNIAAADQATREGRWEKSKFTGTELRKKTLGVLGLGRIGRVVAERALGFEMNVIAYDPVAPKPPAGVRLVTFEECLTTSDFLTIHVPLVEQTRHLIDADAIAKMKRGARLVLAARGGIVDESALCDALDTGHLAGAALDVFEQEPLPKDSRLFRTKNLVLTPHLGAATQEAKLQVSLDMAEQVVTALRRGVVVNGVNVPRIAPGEAATVGPFLDLTHNLAAFLLQVFPGPLHSLRLTLQGDLPASAKRPLTIAMLAGALSQRHQGPITPVNAERVATSTGVRVHAETSTLKRDFLSLVRVEALIGETRHSVSGTVLGNKHGRMVELDHFMLDAILDGSILVTFHLDKPGVMGTIGTILGQEDINIARLQLGAPEGGGSLALGIWNLASPLTDRALARLRTEPVIVQAHRVQN